MKAVEAYSKNKRAKSDVPNFQIFWYLLFHHLSIIGAQSRMPEMQPKKQRTTFQKNEEALDTATTDQNQQDSKCSKTHSVS